MATDAKATFAIELDSSGVVKPGDEAAGVLEKLKAKIQADTAALAQMQKAMRNLQGGASVDLKVFRELTDKINKQKQSIASAQLDFINLGGKLADLGKKAKPSADGIKSLSDVAAATGGPLGRMISSAATAGEKLGSLRLAALAGTAAIVALGVAVAAAIAKVVAFGVASANAARSEFLHLQGLTTIRNWYGLAAGKASDLRDAINDVSNSSALGRDKITGYAESLYKMGLRGQNLNDALEATAIKASVQGEEYASLFMGAAAGANMAGASVKKLADDVRGRLGGIAKAQALDLNVQLQKLHENFQALFQNAAVEPFLRALNEVTQLFSQSSYTGRALKQVVDAIFKPLGGVVEALGPIIKRFFQGVIIAALDLLIVFLRVRNWFRDTFKDVAVFDKLNAALLVGKTYGYLLAGALAALGVVMATGIAIGVAGWIAISYAIKAVVVILQGVWALIKGLGELLGDMAFLFIDGWKQIGKAIIGGLVSGLTNGKDLLVRAVEDLGASIKKKFVSLFEIGSPSKLFFRYGFALPQGAVGGVKKGTPDLKAAIGKMVTRPPDDLGGGAMTVGAVSSPSTSSVVIQQLHYHSGGRDSHEADAEDFRSKLARTLEGLAIQAGATP